MFQIRRGDGDNLEIIFDFSLLCLVLLDHNSSKVLSDYDSSKVPLDYNFSKLLLDYNTSKVLLDYNSSVVQSLVAVEKVGFRCPMYIAHSI